MSRSIWWIGESDVWGTQRKPDRPALAMPLVEETVLPVAENSLAVPKLSFNCAIVCTSRPAQRERLELLARHLNPAWQPVPFHGVVVKSPAGVLSNGVTLVPALENDEIRRLRRYAPYYARLQVVEEMMDWPQYEIDGCVIDGEIMAFHPLLQHWEDGKIVRYSRAKPGSLPEGFVAAYRKAIDALGIDDCCFCIEMRYHKSAWRVVEAHARLGEDDDSKGFREALCDGDPLERIQKFADKG